MRLEHRTISRKDFQKKNWVEFLNFQFWVWIFPAFPRWSWSPSDRTRMIRMSVMVLQRMSLRRGRIPGVWYYCDAYATADHVLHEWIWREGPRQGQHRKARHLRTATLDMCNWHLKGYPRTWSNSGPLRQICGPHPEKWRTFRWLYLLSLAKKCNRKTWRTWR